jgi:hypothetical protein
MRIGFLAPVGAVVAAAIGCGLIDSDISRLTFALPEKTYMVDAGALSPPLGSIPSVPCGDGELVTDCCAPPPPLPTPECSTTPILCLSGVCTARLTVEQSQEINLAQEDARLANRPSFGDLSIASISYRVPENSLNVTIPEIVLTLTDIGGTRSRKFGTIPSIPAGTTVASGNVILEPGAEGIFSEFASDLSKPFKLIGTTTIDVPSGSAAPTGRITVQVTGSLSVSL